MYQKSEQIFILLICRLIQFPKRKEPNRKVFVVDLQVREKKTSEISIVITIKLSKQKYVHFPAF